jgi:hypothetical protein
MNEEVTFDSEFCHVEYVEKDNVVFLTWKKFARLDDYRTPALFAMELLKSNPDSNFVVDTRNGFEDDPADVDWGFTELLPGMARTDCRFVVFIMEKVSPIEGEMDMWTLEFSKYFTVLRAESYEQAIREIRSHIE